MEEHGIHQIDLLSIDLDSDDLAIWEGLYAAGFDMIKSWARSCFYACPPGLQAGLEYYGRFLRPLDASGGPMNGQVLRQNVTREIIATGDITQIVETGTFKGTTTAFLATFGVPVVSVELDARNFATARLRLRRCRNVKLLKANSVDALARLADANRFDQGTTFFYLDAHWREHLPLAKELQLIDAHAVSCVVMIDDFQVPHDPGYGYDDYGPGWALTPEYLVAAGICFNQAWYPAAPATAESGHCRGWVVLGKGRGLQPLERLAAEGRLRMTGL